jgi:hypothetical protein
MVCLSCRAVTARHSDRGRFLVLSVATLVAAVAAAACGSSSSGGIKFAPDASRSDAVSEGRDSAPDLGVPPTPEAGPGCAPYGAGDFSPLYEGPTGPHAGACSLAQLEGLVDDCFGSGATSTACSAWTASTANKTCLGCWSGPATTMGSTWAPVLYTTNGGEAVFPNVAGCIALSDPSAPICAQATEYALECDFQACVSYCPIPTTGSTAAALNALGDCFVQADTESDSGPAGPCASYAEKANQCANELSSGGPAAYCYDVATQATALLQYLELACGPAVDASAPPPIDGGADAK